MRVTLWHLGVLASVTVVGGRVIGSAGDDGDSAVVDLSTHDAADGWVHPSKRDAAVESRNAASVGHAASVSPRATYTTAINLFSFDNHPALPPGVTEPNPPLSPTERHLVRFVAPQALRQLNFLDALPSGGYAIFSDHTPSAAAFWHSCHVVTSEQGTSAPSPAAPAMTFDGVRENLVMRVDVRVKIGHPFIDLQMDHDEETIILPMHMTLSELIQSRVNAGVYRGQIDLVRRGPSPDESSLTWYIGQIDQTKKKCDGGASTSDLVPSLEPFDIPMLNGDACPQGAACGFVSFSTS